MYFSDYIRNCREKCQITQEKMVKDLYDFDFGNFAGLDTTTLSKWERGISKPKIARQAGVIRYFQKLTGNALPCLEHCSIAEAEKMISASGMEHMVGKSRHLILNFPSAMMQSSEITVHQLRHSKIMDDVIDINIDLDRDFNQNSTGLSRETFKKWALHPGSAFYVCEYKEQFFGLLFSLRLKQNVFQALMDFEKEERTLDANDFAAYNEEGNSYVTSFFALNEKAAALLFVRYFAYLIAHQNRIAEVGAATMMEDGKKLIENMHLTHYSSAEIKPGTKMHTYRETLSRLLAQENVVKMILSNRESPGK